MRGRHHDRPNRLLNQLKSRDDEATGLQQEELENKHSEIASLNNQIQDLKR